MKKYLFLLLVFVVISCKSYRQFLDRQPYNVINEKDSLVDGRYIYGFINDNKAKFFFDTGATRSVIQNLDLIGGEDILNTDTSKKLVTINGADGKPFSLYQIKTKNFYTNTYKSNERYLVTFNQKQITNICVEKPSRNFDGILGLDAFVNSRTPVLLDYENSVVMTLEKSPDLNEYVGVDIEIKDNKILLNANINNVKTQLLFDTGSDAYIMLNQNPFFDEPEDLAYETGIITANNVQSYPLNKVYANQSISVGGILNDNNLISVVRSFNANGVGIQFIKNYNWIIDFKKKKVYAKKIKDFNSSSFIEKLTSVKYKVMATNGHLIIFHKKDPANKFKVGDEIVSVDGTIVSKANICEFQDLLNANNNWDKFKIETMTK